MVFYNKYPEDVYKFVADNPSAKPSWLRDKILEKFGVDICRQYIYKLKQHHCWGKKYTHGKSIPSWLQKEEGSERLDKDGYIRVKVGNKEILKHRIEWEKHNPPLKDDEVLMFLDGNRLNCNVRNLIPVKRKYLPAIKMCLAGKEASPKLRKTAILAATLIVDAKEKQIQLKKGGKYSKPKKDDWKDIVYWYKQGKTAREIGEILNKGKGVIYWTIRRYKLGYYDESNRERIR